MVEKAFVSVTTSSKVEAMMRELDLKEQDLDDVMLEQKEASPTESIRWMAIAKVHMVKPYS